MRGGGGRIGKKIRELYTLTFFKKGKGRRSGQRNSKSICTGEKGHEQALLVGAARSKKKRDFAKKKGFVLKKEDSVLEDGCRLPSEMAARQLTNEGTARSQGEREDFQESRGGRAHCEFSWSARQIWPEKEQQQKKKKIERFKRSSLREGAGPERGSGGLQKASEKDLAEGLNLRSQRSALLKEGEAF